MFLNDGSTILSQEGATQGDNLAMPMYAISSRPLIDKVASENSQISQVWYADDATGAGKIDNLRKYWDDISKEGPKFGYFPKDCN